MHCVFAEFDNPLRPPHNIARPFPLHALHALHVVVSKHMRAAELQSCADAELPACCQSKTSKKQKAQQLLKYRHVAPDCRTTAAPFADGGYGGEGWVDRQGRGGGCSGLKKHVKTASKKEQQSAKKGTPAATCGIACSFFLSFCRCYCCSRGLGAMNRRGSQHCGKITKGGEPPTRRCRTTGVAYGR